MQRRDGPTGSPEWPHARPLRQRLGCTAYAVSTREAVIAAQSHEATRAYAEGHRPEDDALAAARQRSTEMGVTPVTPGTGALLHFLAGVLQARAVVEIGTGTGVSGLWLLRGMAPDGILTSIDMEGEHQRLARESFTEAGFTPGRCRLIAGRALEVMPRLADGGYDLVFCDAAHAEYADYLGEALRLLRPGGVVAFDHALLGERVADSSARDPETVAMRELARTVRDDERLLSVLLPVGAGVLAAIKR